MLIASLIAASTVVVSAAQAELVIAFEQVGDDLLVTAEGSIDATGLEPAGTSSGQFNQVYALTGVRGVIRSSSSGVLYELPLTQPIFSEQNGTFADASSASGGFFGVETRNDGSFLLLNSISPDPISASLTFDDISLDDLGVNEQFVSWGASPEQSLRITVVPEPAGALMLLTLAGLTMGRRRASR